MKIIGVIIEGSPIHLGHKYFMDEIKRLYNPDYLIGVSSNYFTMRGEVSTLSKKEKTDLYLQIGFDLILELPVSKTLDSASFFARRSIEILNSLKVTDIVCGIEDTNIDFNSLYELEKSVKFNSLLKKNIKLLQSYKEAMISTFKEFNIDNNTLNNLLLPNTTLAYEYFKQIKAINPLINLSFIKRNNDYKSATFIKNNIRENNEYLDYLPYNENIIDFKKVELSLIKLFKFKLLESTTNDETINYLKNNIDKIHTFDDLKLLSTKNFTTSVLRRKLISFVLSIDNNIKELPYIRLLGLNNNGLSYLKTLLRDEKKDFFSSPNELIDNKILQLELACAKIFDIIFDTNTYLSDEYLFPVRRIK